MEQPTPLSHRISHDTVSGVVHRFYTQVLCNPHLSPFFTHIDDWPLHESHITDFWWGLMGGKVEAPRPNAMENGHRELVFGREALQCWLDLFEQTLHDTLSDDIARQWNTLARRIGDKMLERGMLLTGK